jgi:4-amino-4-deoxy-L-arabinose transferase-like glycosyltransferase
MHRAFIPACIMIGLFVRLAVAVLFPVEPASDSRWYVARANEIASGEGYQEGGFPTAYWPVGWPALLALGIRLLGNWEIAVVIINLLSAAAIMMSLIVAGRYVLGNELVARLALALYAFYPNHIAYSGTAASELPYTAIAIAAFLLLILGRRRILLVFSSGLLFGVATLIKPQTIAFPFGAVIALLILYRDFNWVAAGRTILGVYLACLLVVLPWSYRNYQVFGEWVLVSTNGGTALLLGANDQMTGQHFEYKQTSVFRDLGIPWEDRVERQIELNHRSVEAGLEWIKEHPVEYLAWMPVKLWLLWHKETDGFWAFQRTYPASERAIFLLQLVNQAIYTLIMVLSLIAAFHALIALVRKDAPNKGLALMFCMPVFVSLVGMVFTGQIRYHFAAMPFLVLTAAWTSVWLWSRYGSRDGAETERPGS